MLGKQSKHQAGFALLIFLVIMMGLGGIALTGVTQALKKKVDETRYSHNKEVLNRAKQALLMFAYNYPQTNPTPIGPGRLPCPDDDNNGLIGSGVSIAQCEAVGRLPWNDPRLNTPEFIDASGERLWYAVSSEFRNAFPTDDGANTNGGDTLNSDSLGTITLVDQTGSVIYDGALSGVAAVIIAPGSAISRDTDNDGIYETPQQRATVAQQNNPINYLDTFKGFDNSRFVDGSNALADGFILGPIRETRQTSPSANTIIVNDQIVVITAAEVIEMAEKATLQAYKNAINNYRVNIQIDTPSFDAYPWLDTYSTLDAITTYDAELNTLLGMVPSIFAKYFDGSAANPASQAIISEVLVEGINVAMSVAQANGFPLPPPLIDFGVVSDSSNPDPTSVKFNASADLEITSSDPPVLLERFFWDEAESGFGSPLPGDGWEECLPRTTGTVQDCNQSNSLIGVPNSSIVPNQHPTRVLHVAYEVNLISPLTLSYSNNTGAETYRVPTATDHAFIFSGYTGVSTDGIDINYEYDDYYDTSFVSIESGALTNYNYRLGVRYYPELPSWALAVNDNWHDSIQMVFSSGFEPDGGSSCLPGTDCLTVNSIGGVENNKQALIILASDHGLTDDATPNGFQDNLADIFDAAHTQADGVLGWDIFDNRSDNDRVLLIR